MTIGHVPVWGLLAALTGCQQKAPSSVNTASTSASSLAGLERGMAVAVMPFILEVMPFTLEVTPRLRGSREIVLKNGDQVVSGDTIKVEVKTSVNAHLYLGYCDKAHKLTIYPREGSIEAKAGKITYVPHRDAVLRLDDQLGSEVLYVIASRRKLDLGDPELAEAISRFRPDADSLECAPLNRALGKKKPPEPVIASASSKRLHKTPEPEPSGPERKRADLGRGGYIRWEATGGVSAGGDRDGIVVLRYTFTHVDSLGSP